MKKLLIPFLLSFAAAFGQSYSNLQFDPTTGIVQHPVTTPFSTTYPTTLSQFGISDATIVLTTGTYSNPAWITTLAFSKLSGTPTSLAGYGITDPVALTTGSYANPTWITALAFTKLTGVPTTVAGLGITNGAAIDALGANGSAFYTNAGNLSTGTLLAARLPAFTGDATATIGTSALTFATVNTNVGTFGDATHAVTYTVNAKGLSTANAQVLITPAFASLTGLPTTLAGFGITDGVNSATNDTNVTFTIAGHAATVGFTGTLAAARLNANTPQAVVNDTNVTGSIATQSLTLGWTGTLAANRLNASVVEAFTNDTNITASITAQNATLAWAGTLAAGRLNANVVQAITNGTNVTGSITAQNLTLGFTGQLAIASGGTGASTASNGFNALSPLTTLGDILYGGASGAGTRLPGNTTSGRQFLSQTGNGTISAIPVWTLLSTSDIPTLSLATAVSGTLQAAQEPAHTGDATNSAGSLAMTVKGINGTLLSSLATGLLKNTTATAAISIAAAGTDYLGITGGSTITAVGALASGSLTTGFTAVAIAQGGTGQATATSAFNALSPMTTAGDLIIGGAAGAGTRLAIGANTFVLTSNGTTATWAASSGGGGSVTGSGSTGQLATWATSSSLSGVTALPAANFPALTGDVTTSAGALATTVVRLNGVSLAGLATGLLKNTTTTGAPSIAAAGTDYLAPFSGITANFVYASPNGSSGAPSFRALVATDIPTISAATQLSGTLPAAQFGALSGDVTSSAGSYATVVGKIGGNTVSLGGSFTMAGAFTFAGTITGNTAVTFPTTGTLLTSTTGVSALAGTANQITASASVGSVTLSLPTVLTLPGTMSTIGSQTATLAGIQATSTDGQVLQNTTAATSGVPIQLSPRLRFTGFGWQTSGTPASKEGDWIIENQVTSGATVLANLVYSYQVAGSGYTPTFQFSSNGTFSALNGAINLAGNTPTDYALAITTSKTLVSSGFSAVNIAPNITSSANGNSISGVFINPEIFPGAFTGQQVTGLTIGGANFGGAVTGTSIGILITDLGGTQFSTHYGIEQTGTSPNLFAGSIQTLAALSVGTTLTVTGASTFGNTVLINGNPATINYNTAASPGQGGFTGELLFSGASADGSPAYSIVDTFAAQASVFLRRADGTNASKTAIISGDSLGQFAWAGWDSVSYNGGPVAGIRVVATENWSPTAHGNYMAFYNTAQTTLSTSEKMRLWGSGGLTLGNSIVTTDPGTASLLVAGTGTFTGNTMVGANSGTASLQNILTIAGSNAGTGAGPFLNFSDSTGNIGQVGSRNAFIGGTSRNLDVSAFNGIDFITGNASQAALTLTSAGNANFGGTTEGHPNGFTANGVVATAVTSVGPTGSHTTVQKWLTVNDGTNTFYLPAF